MFGERGIFSYLPTERSPTIEMAKRYSQSQSVPGRSHPTEVLTAWKRARTSSRCSPAATSWREVY